MVRWSLILILSLASGVGCRPKTGEHKQTLTVFVAASLTDVTQDFASGFTKQTGISVETSVAASGILRRQIEGGAPCDVFISADGTEMDLLAEKRGVVESTRRELARNQLVIVASGEQDEWSSVDPLLASKRKIAIGDPRYVPAGRYAERELKDLKLWDELQDRLVLADNVRVALQYVKSHQVEFAIVYRTDAMTSDCSVVFRFPTESVKIACFGATCTRSENQPDANAFLDMMVDSKQDDIWTRHGFVPVRRDAD